MSKAMTRFPLPQAKAWAFEAMDAIAICAPRVQVAGSIRRERNDIGDIDLVLLDETYGNPWQHSAIGNALAELGYAQTKDGDRIASFTREGRCGLDLYFATPETWGITLLVRTGSTAHNIKLTQVAQRMLPARSLKVSQGIVDTAGRVIASKTEEDIFAALRVPFVRPEDRESPEFQAWIRDE